MSERYTDIDARKRLAIELNKWIDENMPEASQQAIADKLGISTRALLAKFRSGEAKSAPSFDIYCLMLRRTKIDPRVVAGTKVQRGAANG